MGWEGRAGGGVGRSTIFELNRNSLIRTLHQESTTLSASSRVSSLEVSSSAWSSLQAGQRRCELT